MKDNIKHYVDNGMCCACGICVGACPKRCIALKLDRRGVPRPVVTETQCSQCGICADLCPGKAGVDETLRSTGRIIDMQVKGVTEAYTGYICDKELILKTASGGICSELIRTLLKEGVYDVAFAVDTYNYAEVVRTAAVATEDIVRFAKSRYVPVSHENAVRYMLKNRNKKVVLVGTSCAILGFRRVFKEYKLSQENYLLIGLFCDKIMSNRVWAYFDKQYGPLEQMHFKNKEHGGWPGDMKLLAKNRDLSLPKSHRTEVKDYFCMERCLYCQDKLNQYADISLGDNYTGENADKRGSSCVLIRTEAGRMAFDRIREKCVLFPSDAETVAKSQQVGKRRENRFFARLRYGQGKGVGLKMRAKYAYKRLKIRVGDHPAVMRVLIRVEKMLRRKKR